MGLKQVGYFFDVEGATIIDIGGGPTSMLLKTINIGLGPNYTGCGMVVDPIEYPKWTYDRYALKGIECCVIRGEDFKSPICLDKFDECWIYNCLQHTDDPKKIIKNALSLVKTLRIFEWVDVPAHEGHPQEITKNFLDSAIGSEGKVVQLAESGCFGKAYYNIHTQQ